MALWDDWNYAAPGSTGGPQQTMPNAGGGDLTFGLVPRGSDINIGLGKDGPPSMWSKLLDTVGSLGSDIKGLIPPAASNMPGGATSMGSQVPPLRPAGQMPTPPGLGAYFQAMQTPQQGGTLMAQYMALQRLMRGG